MTGEISDMLLEEAMNKVKLDVGRRYNSDTNKSVAHFILHPKLTIPISMSETFVKLKLARKVTERSERNIKGVWDTLAPGSTVVCTSPSTAVIEEPGVPEVKVRNSDIAKFGSKAERNTDLWQYTQRRPLPYDKTTEEKIAFHLKELKKK